VMQKELGLCKPATTTLSLFEDKHSILRHGHEHHLSLGDNLGSPHGHHKNGAGQEQQHHLSGDDKLSKSVDFSVQRKNIFQK
jgi:hypothetical protein